MVPYLLRFIIAMGYVKDEFAPPAGPYHAVYFDATLSTFHSKVPVVCHAPLSPTMPPDDFPAPMLPCLLAPPSFPASQAGETSLHVAAGCAWPHTRRFPLPRDHRCKPKS